MQSDHAFVMEIHVCIFRLRLPVFTSATRRMTTKMEATRRVLKGEQLLKDFNRLSSSDIRRLSLPEARILISDGCPRFRLIHPVLTKRTTQSQPLDGV